MDDSVGRIYYVEYPVHGFREVTNVIEQYSRVRLLTNHHDAEGAPTGAIGYVIEVYDDGALEVEFSDENGVTFAQVVVRESELALDEPEPQ
jgi:hypothetical protein